MSRRSSAGELRAVESWYLGEWRRRGFAHDYRWVERSDYDHRQLTVSCADGNCYTQVLSNHELEMGDVRALEHWFRVFDDTLHRAEMEWRRRERPQSIHEEMRRADQEIARFTGLDRRFIETFTDFSIDHSETERRSEELFRKTAGELAWNLLKHGKRILIRGSEGGAYRMIKQASYCITRESDGARMCAVVPGVPLWDHLLGIKLTIEQDEPRFLRTANVSGEAYTVRYYHDPYENVLL